MQLVEIIEDAQSRTATPKPGEKVGVPLPPLTRSQVMSYWADIRKVEEQQRVADEATERAQQLLELRTELRAMKQQNPRPWASINRHHRLIAEMTGTLQPIEVGVSVDVDIRVRSAIMAVVGDMGSERIQELAREQLELEELAGKRH